MPACSILSYFILICQLIWRICAGQHDFPSSLPIFHLSQDFGAQDVILDRKLNKILVRLRFRKVESPTAQDLPAAAGAKAGWAFFIKMTMKFSVRFSAEEVKLHELQLVLSLIS